MLWPCWCLSTQLGSVTGQVHRGHLSWEQNHRFSRGRHSACGGWIDPMGSAPEARPPCSVSQVTRQTAARGPSHGAACIRDLTGTHKPYPRYLSLQTKGFETSGPVHADAGGDRQCGTTSEGRPRTERPGWRRLALSRGPGSSAHPQQRETRRRCIS